MFRILDPAQLEKVLALGMGKPAKMGSPQGQTVGVGEGITMTATPIAHHLPMSFCFYGGLGFFHTFPVVEGEGKMEGIILNTVSVYSQCHLASPPRRTTQLERKCLQ